MALPQTYEDIVDQLGDVLPCYKRGKIGCIANEEINDEVCNDGCLLLRVYEAGYAKGAEGRKLKERK